MNQLTPKILCLLMSCLTTSLLAKESKNWGEFIQLEYKEKYSKSSRLGKLKRQDKTHQIKFIDSNRSLALPFWYRKVQEEKSDWIYVEPLDEIEASDLDYILEFDLGYSYLKPVPMRIGQLGLRQRQYEAQAWNGDHWSPYKSMAYASSDNLRLPERLHYLEAWQVSSGIESVIWPWDLVKLYPRASMMSAESGKWRSLCQLSSRIGALRSNYIFEYGDELIDTIDESEFRWLDLFTYYKNARGEGALTYGPSSFQASWKGKMIYPIIPLMIAGPYVDIIEMNRSEDLENYRFLLTQGHRVSHYIMKDHQSIENAFSPDFKTYRFQDGRSDLASLKGGYWAGAQGFAFDWVLEKDKPNDKTQHRAGQSLLDLDHAYRPLFRFTKHSSYSPIAFISLYKSEEEMVKALVPESITQGSLDLGRYYFKEQDHMSLVITHKDGTRSSVNPIYIGEPISHYSKETIFPLELHDFPDELGEIYFHSSDKKLTLQKQDKNLRLDLPWYEQITLTFGLEKKSFYVWSLWLDQASAELDEGAGFVEQYECFEQSFPLKFSFKS